MKVTFKFKKIGKILENKAFIEYFKTLKDGEYRIEICKWRNKRSDLQNKYYWGGVIPILSEELGYENYEKEELHEILKAKFLKDFKNVGKERIDYSKSTTLLSTKEFMEYVDKIIRWAAQELNIYIPDPEGNMIIKK